MVKIELDLMVITYNDKKACDCYKDLMKNPTDRACIRNFSKTFTQNIIKSAIQLHERLTAFETALDYNKVYGQTDNRIELLSGTGKKENLVLKVRINRDYRKFFYFLYNEDKEPLITELWTGQFNEVKFIHVFEINKHDYQNI
ncbi:MAG: hypothetical protein LBL79_09190 [Prevotella sp.]|jgi:plasmid maintenance system killer protein|nr:hypothetical protein [Prevotella sp.]